MTVTLHVDPAAPDPEVIERAASVLRAGGLVAFPTETVYGLGAHALDADAVRRIYDAKGRPAYNPLIVHVPDAGTAHAVVREWPERAARLAEAFWPGPVTMVLPKRPEVPDAVTAGLDSVAVRVPAHPVALALLRAAGIPVAAPSANRFTELSPTAAAHVAKGLGGRVDLILDGGPTSVGIESTVVDLAGERPVLLRPGLVSREELEAVLGPVLESAEITGDAPRPSPGMVERHYAPRAELRIAGESSDERLRELVRAAGRGERIVGVVLRGERGRRIAERQIELPDDPAGYARGLYAALHRLDDDGCDLVFVEPVPDDARWAGVHDRLRRATHGA